MDNDSLELPGGEDFIDVTDIFENEAQSIEVGRPLFADGFTLQDAMSALEIGEPRMDSGMILEQERKPPFDTLMPLLPEELCWILDRSFSCEMQWHAGNTLSQTVYTLLYVHSLSDMDPEFVSRIWSFNKEDSSRPLELVTIVLRSAVFGLLKSCALAWVELAKSRVYDQEDWHSEKSEISLCEGIPVATVISKLEEAVFWLRNTRKLTKSWRDSLIIRIQLRKVIVELLALELPRERDLLVSKATDARSLLQRIQKKPAFELPQNSVARLAFDPHITRRLHSFMPQRVVELFPLEQTWSALNSLFSGLLEVYNLSGNLCLATWDIVGSVHVLTASSGERLPYLRSLTQTVFHHGDRVLSGLPQEWIVDRFFLESVDISYSCVSDLIRRYWKGADQPPLPMFEARIIKVLKDHIASSWYNPPRRRRHLMNISSDWHVLHDLFLRLLDLLKPSRNGEGAILRFLPHIPLIWRLSAILDIIFSGFQLDLYGVHERAFAYWYATQVIEMKLGCTEDLLVYLSPDSLPHREYTFQHTYLTAIQSMSIGMTLILLKQGIGTEASSNIHSPGFSRRYKWAFGVDLSASSNQNSNSVTFKTPDILIPNVNNFIEDCDNVKKCDIPVSALSCWQLAKDLLSNLVDSPGPVGWSDIWSEDRRAILKSLVIVCSNYLILLQDNPAEVRFIWQSGENILAFPHVKSLV